MRLFPPILCWVQWLVLKSVPFSWGELLFTEIGHDKQGLSGLDWSYANVDYDYYYNLGVQRHPSMFRYVSDGQPGVALFDFDNDNDLDIYVTSDVGLPNGLFRNMMRESGTLRFMKISEQAGVDLVDHRSTGTCFGDIDNDGDEDLLVLGSLDYSPALFLNNGDGTFTDISENAILDSLREAYMASCSFGDVTGDGLLDIWIATRAFDDCESSVPNILLINQGDLKFSDETIHRGLTHSAIAWACALVDYDLDGDLDAFSAEDGEVCGDFQLTRIYRNDGFGYFTDISVSHSVYNNGGYMGLTFADYDGDGTIDVFVTDIGSFGVIKAFESRVVPPDTLDSRFFLNDENHVFRDPGLGQEINHTAFGWGCASFDVDNDGLTDILFHGGSFSDQVNYLADNNGPLFKNRGNAQFVFDEDATSDTDHRIRKVTGVAVGDLNNDGFTDVVTVSQAGFLGDLITFTEAYQDVSGSVHPLGTPFDDTVGFVPELRKTGNGYVFNEVERYGGSLSVEINSGHAQNRYIAVKLFGTVGITSLGKTPRDGIGAVIKVTPFEFEQSQMIPVVGGDSYGSQSQTKKIFGIASARFAMVEVIWSGRVYNRIYDVIPEEELFLPEIPCDIASVDWTSEQEFLACLDTSFREMSHLLEQDKIDRFRRNMMRGFGHYRDTPLVTVGDTEGRTCINPTDYDENDVFAEPEAEPEGDQDSYAQSEPEAEAEPEAEPEVDAEAEPEPEPVAEAEAEEGSRITLPFCTPESSEDESSLSSQDATVSSPSQSESSHEHAGAATRPPGGNTNIGKPEEYQEQIDDSSSIPTSYVTPNRDELESESYEEISTLADTVTEATRLSGSCRGSCGSRSPDGCFCDASCPQQRNCCPDILVQCAKN